MQFPYLFYRHKYLVYNMFCSIFASVLEWQTGTTQNRMIDYRVGSSPITRTKALFEVYSSGGVFFMSLY